MRSSVHPPATLECEHPRWPVMAAMACGLQPHPGGARHAARRYRNDQPGTAPTRRPTRSHTAQPDCSLRSVHGRSSSGTAFQPPFGPCKVARLRNDVQQSRSSRRPPCAHCGVPVVPPSSKPHETGPWSCPTSSLVTVRLCTVVSVIAAAFRLFAASRKAIGAHESSIPRFIKRSADTHG